MDTCLFCDEPVTPGDLAVPINDGTTLVHRECMLRTVLGSVAHQKHRCSCYGGDEGDDPALTPRENARSAVAFWREEEGE